MNHAGGNIAGIICYSDRRLMPVSAQIPLRFFTISINRVISAARHALLLNEKLRYFGRCRTWSNRNFSGTTRLKVKIFELEVI